jgi:hypothetical protein
MRWKQVLERLLAKIDVKQAKPYADGEHMQEILTRMDANKKAMQGWMDANTQSMIEKWTPNLKKGETKW